MSSIQNLIIEGCKGVVMQYAILNTTFPFWEEQNPYIKAFISSVAVTLLHTQINAA